MVERFWKEEEIEVEKNLLNSVNRLKKNKEFNYIYKRGKVIFSKFYNINYVKTNRKDSKFGISVNKKVGKSVIRSRIKRLLSEVIRHNLSNIVVNNYVITAKNEIVGKTYHEIEKDLLDTLNKAGLLKNVETL